MSTLSVQSPDEAVRFDRDSEPSRRPLWENGAAIAFPSQARNNLEECRPYQSIKPTSQPLDGDPSSSLSSAQLVSPFARRNGNFPPSALGAGRALPLPDRSLTPQLPPSSDNASMQSIVAALFACQNEIIGPTTTPNSIRGFHPSPLVLAMLDTTIVPLLETFYERIYQMMPIFPPQYIFGGIPSTIHTYPCIADRTSDPVFLGLIVSMSALASIHPLQPHELSMKPQRVRQSTALLDEACRLASGWSHGGQVNLEQILTAYLAFGTFSELQCKDAAAVKFRETLALADVMRLGETVLNDEEQGKREKAMSCILAVTEL